MTNKYREHSKLARAHRQLWKRIHRKDGVNCIKKRKHRTAQEAMDWADKRGFSYTRAYQCCYCHSFHLTTKP